MIFQVILTLRCEIVRSCFILYIYNYYEFLAYEIFSQLNTKPFRKVLVNRYFSGFKITLKVKVILVVEIFLYRSMQLYIVVSN